MKTATNPETGERVELVGGEWRPIKAATNPETGERVELLGGEWRPAEPKKNRVQEVAEGGRNLALEAADFGAGAYRAHKKNLPRPMRWDEGVDYKTGVKDKDFRAALSFADTDDEREQYLNNRLGEDGWFKDSAGRYVVSRPGMIRLKQYASEPTAIDERGPSWGDVADWAGDAGPVAGAVAAGTAAGPLGWLAGGLIAAGGAMLTKAAQETGEEFGGANLQSAGEVTADVGKEGLLALGGEIAGRGVIAGGRRLLGPHAARVDPSDTRGFWQRSVGRRPELRSEVEPRRLELADEAQEWGALPTIYQASGARIAGRTQEMIHTIFGRGKYDHLNREAIVGRATRLVDESGPENFTRSGLGKVDSVGNPAISQSSAGAPAKEAISSKLSQMRTNVSDSIRRVESSLSRSISRMRASLKPDAEAPTVREAIRSARESMSSEFKKAYGAIDDAVDGLALVPSQRLKNAARAILEASPKTKGKTAQQSLVDPSGNPLATWEVAEGADDAARAFLPSGVRQQISDILKMEDAITLRQAQTVRTLLREAMGNETLLPGMSRHHISELRKALDTAFDEIPAFLDSGAAPNIFQGAQALAKTPQEAKAAARALRETNEAYKKAIQRFDDQFIERLARSTRQSGAIPDEAVGDRLMNASVDSIKRARAVAGEKAWNQMLYQHFDSMVRGIADGGEASGKALFNRLTGMKGGRFNAIYGDKAPEVRKLLKEIAAVNGKISPDDLAGGDVVSALKAKLAATKEWDEAMSNSFFREIEAGTLEPDDITRYIFRPSGSGKKSPIRLIRQTKEILGENSVEWLRVRQRAMYEIVDSMIVKSPDSVTDVISGANLQKTLNRYGDDVIKEMFGAEKAADLQKFADVTSLLTSSSTMSGGIVAANIALHPLRNLGRILYLKLVLSKFFGHPNGVKYFTRGIVDPSGREGLKSIVRSSVLMQTLVDDQTASEADPLREQPQE